MADISLNVPMSVAIAEGQIQGEREMQEDAVCSHEWDKDCFFMVVADGIGGAPGGDVASNMAMLRFADSFSENETANIRDRLLDALRDANRQIHYAKKEQPVLSEMGTTLVGAAVVDDQLHWVSVGDSPLWLIRDGAIRRLNANHSMGGILDMRAGAGEITPEEAARSPQRSILLDAVQGADIEYVDAPEKALDLLPGDTVIVASDGVETCANDELVAIATAGRPSAADIVGAVLDAVSAHRKPGQDNATLIVYRPR